MDFPSGSVVRNPPAKQETGVQCLGWDDPLEKEMATHFSILAWRIPWTGEPGGLQSMGSQRVGHDLLTKQQITTTTRNYIQYLVIPISASVCISYSSSLMTIMWNVTPHLIKEDIESQKNWVTGYLTGSKYLKLGFSSWSFDSKS